MQKPCSQYQLILVGLGRVAIKHLKAYYRLRDYFNSLILVEPNSKNASDFTLKQQKYLPQSYHIYSDLASALSSPYQGERIVAITTPSNLHYVQAKLALEHNCHCLIEKPVTLDLKEAKELLQISQRKQLKVALGHIYRYIPLVRELQAKLKEGLIGRIFNAHLNLEWGHEQAYYDQADWRGRYAQDGGVLMNQSIHAMDLLFYLLDSQLAYGTAYLAQLNHQIEAEDYASCLIVDTKGRQLSLNCSTASLSNQHYASFKLFGEKGDLTLAMHNKAFKLSYHDEAGRERRLSLIIKLLLLYCRHLQPSFLTSFVNPHQAIYADLLEAIQTKKSCLADLTSGFNALKAILTIYKAAQEQSYACSTPLENSASMQEFFQK